MNKTCCLRPRAMFSRKRQNRSAVCCLSIIKPTITSHQTIHDASRASSRSSRAGQKRQVSFDLDEIYNHSQFWIPCFLIGMTGCNSFRASLPLDPLPSLSGL